MEKGTIIIRKDNKLKMYRHLMERAFSENKNELYEFWKLAYDKEWIKIYSASSSVKERRK